MNIPRILIAAPSSGSGKTVISCGLMAAFCRQQKNVVSCKCGPDYIDPMFHREVLGIDSQNLDLFFCEKEQLTGIFAEHAKNADLAVVEGVMGYYDGMGLDTAKASSYDVAAALQIPVVLVVSARGSALSLAALVKGFLEFKKESRIRGILLNRVSAMLYPRLKEMLENELKKAGHPIKVLGYIPEHEAFHLKSRHLGLVTPEEIKHLKAQLEQAGEILSETVDLEGLYELAKEAPSLEISVPEDEEKENPKVSIAVARDEAFGFYYKDNLKLLERYGCNLVYFSPIRDTHLPEGVSGLLLGGGYPELYARELSENKTMLAKIRESIQNGMPCHAECGGFLYLHEKLADPKGKLWKMAGVIRGEAAPKEKLVRFGYINLTGVVDGTFLKRGERIRGHEFHYWDSTNNGTDAKALKPDGKRSWECVHMQQNLFAGFPHLSYSSNPVFAERFMREAIRWEQSQKEGSERKMTLEELKKEIRPLDETSMEQARKHWIKIAKPLFSLGKLEDAVIQMAGIKETPDYELKKKALVIMCADNGIVEEGVTQTGQEVTAMVADNFTKSSTSVCAMSKVAGVDLFPVDIGMAVDVPSVTVKEEKVAYGTRNFSKEPAMTREEVWQAIEIGIRKVEQLKEQGYEMIATGEMGIGNTTTSSAVASVLLSVAPEQVTGRGAGLSSAGLEKKISVIKDAIANYQPDKEDPVDVLSKVGGLDIAGLTGVFLGGALYRVPVVIDGFISSVAALCAARMVPVSKSYFLPSHVSKEPAGAMLLEALELSPLLTCNMSLGEGTGAVAVIPVLEMGLSVYREMTTFEKAKIEQYEVLK